MFSANFLHFFHFKVETVFLVSVERFVVYYFVYLRGFFFLIDDIVVPGCLGTVQNRLASNSDIACLLV